MSKKALKEMSEIIDNHIAVIDGEPEFNNPDKVATLEDGINIAIEEIMGEEGDDTEKQEICDFLRTRVKEQVAKWSN